jgi:hypothetical protein
MNNQRDMKARTLLLVLVFGIFTTLAQMPPKSSLRITGFLRSNATLFWTNDVCANVPVYGVMRSLSPTGTWQHFFFATNVHSTVLTNSLGQTPGGVFHKLAWVSDTLMVFDYSFDEGFGCPAVTGTLNVSLANIPSGTWQLEEGVCSLDGLHPTGNGNFSRGSITATNVNHMLTLWFTAFGGEGYFLEGTLQQATVNGQRVYTGMSGLVYVSGFAAPSPIGTFTATRTQ